LIDRISLFKSENEQMMNILIQTKTDFIIVEFPLIETKDKKRQQKTLRVHKTFNEINKKGILFSYVLTDHINKK
jgi:hypothetical protein